MTANRDLRSRLVVGQKRDGRREFDENAIRELVALCLRPGVSIARYQPQMQHGCPASDSMVIDGVSIDVPAPALNSPGNASALPAFVPVVSGPVSSLTQCDPVPSMVLALQVRLPNGVELDFGEASVEEIATIIQMLGRMPCSGSTKI
ncbi:IS66 family insertion sequence element accessory protein TnpB [Paraburkholderia guartelaensis]|uniref:IS66 family insertion sequence element accessory protein TnpB n=1 Tax=Paraburkholderia guartelaensis TaxID=2546446 RepID=A0ABU9SP12_9BURK